MIVGAFWTWKLKLGLSIALLASGVWFLKYREARAYERGKDAGQLELLGEQRKQLEAEYAETRESLAQERAELDVVRESLNAERASLNGQRRAISEGLARGLNEITSREASIRNEALSVADPDLIPAIRQTLADIRTAESTRPPR